MLDHPATRLYVKNIASLAVLVVVAMMVRGCVAITPAAYERGSLLFSPEPLDDDAWPKRNPDPVRALIAASTTADGHRKYSSTQLEHISRIVGFFSPRLQHATYGRGIVCELPPPADARSRKMVYITNRLSSDGLAAALESDRMPQEDRDKLLRWHFTFQMPATSSPRGLIVHLTSLGDRRFEESVSDTLRNRGWAVLRVVPGRIVVPYMHERVGDEPRRIIPGSEVAVVMDEYAADYAYAVEGVLQYLREREPGLNGQPLVVTGYSAGALALPTVAARLDRVDAAVFVGGGANAAGILVNGSITNVVQVIRNHGDGHLLPELRRMPDAYLEASRFDPYHMAPYLAGKPVLMLQGSIDRIIPRQYGDLLYERLGRPERWMYPLGHVPLFWVLPSQSSRVANWIERNVD